MKNTLPIILIAVSVGLFYLHISPSYAKLGELQTRRDSYDQILSKSVELRQIRSELAQKTSRFSEFDLAKLDKMIPINMDLVRLILEVDSIALKHAIVISDINTSAADTRGGADDEGEVTRSDFKTIGLTFRFETDYSNLNGFIQEIESSLRILDIVNVQISTNKERPSFQDYEMTINTYYLQ